MVRTLTNSRFELNRDHQLVVRLLTRTPKPLEQPQPDAFLSSRFEAHSGSSFLYILRTCQDAISA